MRCASSENPFPFAVFFICAFSRRPPTESARQIAESGLMNKIPVSPLGVQKNLDKLFFSIHTCELVCCLLENVNILFFFNLDVPGS